MTPFRGNLRYRPQHKGTLGNAGVGQNRRRLTADESVKVYEIEIKNARAPFFTMAPPCPGFN
jgi:hypothetical protein